MHKEYIYIHRLYLRKIHAWIYSYRETLWNKLSVHWFILVHLTSWPYGEMIFYSVVSLRINKWAYWSRADIKPVWTTIYWDLPTPERITLLPEREKHPEPWSPPETRAAGGWQETRKGCSAGGRSGGTSEPGEGQFSRVLPWEPPDPGTWDGRGEREKGDPRVNSCFSTFHFFLPFPQISPNQATRAVLCHRCHFQVTPVMDPFAA